MSILDFVIVFLSYGVLIAAFYWYHKRAMKEFQSDCEHEWQLYRICKYCGYKQKEKKTQVE